MSRLRLRVIPGAGKPGVVGRYGEVVAGHGSHDKTVEVSGLTTDEAGRRLAR